MLTELAEEVEELHVPVVEEVQEVPAMVGVPPHWPKRWRRCRPWCLIPPPGRRGGGGADHGA